MKAAKHSGEKCLKRIFKQIPYCVQVVHISDQEAFEYLIKPFCSKLYALTL